MSFKELREIDVSNKVEKKNKFSYLSWAWALDTLLQKDESANWEYHEPVTFNDGTMMVSCTVTAFGIPRRMQLPVIDYKNQPIANPNAFQVNTAMQRCLVKAIALHGLGLYIYAGEDIPEVSKEKQEEFNYKAIQTDLWNQINECMTEDEVHNIFANNRDTIDKMHEEAPTYYDVVEAISNEKLRKLKDGDTSRHPYEFLGTEEAYNWYSKRAGQFTKCETYEELMAWLDTNQHCIEGIKIKLKAKKYERDGKKAYDYLMEKIEAKKAVLSQSPLQQVAE